MVCTESRVECWGVHAEAKWTRNDDVERTLRIMTAVLAVLAVLVVLVLAGVEH